MKTEKMILSVSHFFMIENLKKWFKRLITLHQNSKAILDVKLILIELKGNKGIWLSLPTNERERFKKVIIIL